MNTKRYRAALAALVTVTVLGIWHPVAAQADEDPACSLRPSGHAQGQEWLSCLRVSAELVTLPAVGQEATLVIEVTAQQERPDLTVEADLPSGLEWVRTPDGFETRTVPSDEPADGGPLNRATGRVSLAANETRRIEGVVRARQAGGAHVAVRLIAPPQVDPEDGTVIGQEAADDHQYLTIAQAGGTSAPGIAGRPDGEAARPSSSAEPTRATPHLDHLPVPAEPQPSVAPMAPGDTSCVAGSFGYLDGAVNRVSPNILVEVWDADTFDGPDLLATVLTDANGAYFVCFPTDDPDGPFIDFGQDVFVKFITQNARWRVQETGTGSVYSWTTATVFQVGANSTLMLGYQQPGDPKYHLGLRAFDAVNDFWNWKPGTCWDANDAVANCRQVVVNWRWDSMIGTFYDPSTRQVFLMAADPKSKDVVVHEATHSVMDDVYEFTPIPGAGGPHNINQASNAGLAWVEGFAEWTPVQVYASPIFEWPNGATLNLETPKWGTANWGNGDITEGRVAGALIDLSDVTNETPWDRLAEGNGPGNIWTTFLGPAIGPPRVAKSFKEFWDHRTLDGFNVSATGGLVSVYQNTIDYKFRDPIGNYAPLLRPHPYAPHNFSFNTTSVYWSAVASRPAAGVDHDLKLFDDFNLTTSLGTSAAGGSTVDFIAIDSNKRPLGDYYPQVYKYSGTGNCRVELAQGSVSLAANASQVVAMGSASVVAVRDTYLNASASVTIKVTPGNASQDPELFLMSSTAGQPATFIRSRAQAAKSATTQGPGLAETLTFTAPAAGWYGVVIINKTAVAGNYTLQRIG